MMSKPKKVEITTNLQMAIQYLTQTLGQVGTEEHLNKKNLEIVNKCLDIIIKIDSGLISVD